MRTLEKVAVRQSKIDNAYDLHIIFGPWSVGCPLIPGSSMEEVAKKLRGVADLIEQSNV